MLNSDAGAQYTVLRYSEQPADVGTIASIGKVGDSYHCPRGNSLGLYNTECVKIDGPFCTTDELEFGTLSLVHWFNANRLHPSIGHLTPVETRD